jgi:integrase
VLDLLREHKANQQKSRQEAAETWIDKDLVFCHKNGDYIPPTTLRFWFIKLLAAAGLPYMRVHDLRHSAVTLLLIMGVPPNVVQEIAGHSRINITLGMYGHVIPGMHEEAMRRWDTALGDKEAGARREALRQQWQDYSQQSQALLETLLKLYGEHAARLALDAIQGL